MPAILQRTLSVMSTDKENNKLEETKVSENDVKDEVKKAETNDVDSPVKEDKKDEAAVAEGEPEKTKEKEKPSKPSSRKAPTKVKETKKKEEKSEDEDEKDVDEEDDDDNDDDEAPAKVEKDAKGVPLLDQPLHQSGTRQRKVVERFSLKVDESAPIDIPEGTGVSLGSISVIEYNITKFKGDDLKKLHQILFGGMAKATFIKKNIRKFNGFDFDLKSEQYEKKMATIQKLELKALKEVSNILNLAAVGSRDELSTALMDFLMEPHATSGNSSSKVPATTSLTKGGRPKRVAAARANDKGYSESEDEDDMKARTPRSRRSKGKRPNLKDESSSEDEREKKSDDEKASDVELSVEETPSSDESDTESKRKRAPVKPPPKAAPKKAPAKKAAPPPKKADKKAKRKSESEDDSSEDDEPLVKKSKSPPTDDEIKTFVKGILEGANLEEITMKTVCKQVYAHYPDFDLAHKKDFIKSTVKSLIST